MGSARLLHAHLHHHLPLTVLCPLCLDWLRKFLTTEVCLTGHLHLPTKEILYQVSCPGRFSLGQIGGRQLNEDSQQTISCKCGSSREKQVCKAMSGSGGWWQHADLGSALCQHNLSRRKELNSTILLDSPHTWGVKAFEVHARGQMGLALQFGAALWPVGLQFKGHRACAVPPHGCITNMCWRTSLTRHPCWLCRGRRCMPWGPG